jgi:homoserine O-acetyltransferase
MRIHFFLLIALSLVLSPALAEESAKPAGTLLGGIESNYSIKDFHFSDGETLPELRIHYRTLGKPISSSGHVQNAVLLLHGTSSTGDAFLAQGFRSAMFGPGQPLDASKYYLILPDSIGLGGSSKPSEGLHGRFPHYGYQDMVAAQNQLVTQGLGVNHLAVVLGTSMGGMHAWLWAEKYPNLMDAVIPIACQPEKISGAQSSLEAHDLCRHPLGSRVEQRRIPDPAWVLATYLSALFNDGGEPPIVSAGNWNSRTNPGFSR